MDLMEIVLNSGFRELKNQVEDGADIRVRNEDGGTLLHAATEGGRLDIFVFLTQLGLDPHDVSNTGRTVLQAASLDGQYHMVKYLCSKYPDLKNKVDVDKWTALHYCAQGGSVEIFKYLVSQGLDVTSATTDGGNVLQIACSNGRYVLVQHIVSEFPDLKHKLADNKWTALHYCAQGGSVDIFKFLISQGLDVTSKITHGLNVLHIACNNGRYELVKHTVSEFPELTNKVADNKCTALYYSVQGGSVDIFKYLVSQGLVITSVTTHCGNVLQIACSNGRYELVKHIVSEFPDLKNKIADNKWTALHYCAQGGSVDIFKFLISQGLDVTSKTTHGLNVLHIACNNGRYELVKHIVSEFPDLKLKVAKNKWTALHYCAKSGSVDTFKFLVSQGLDVTSVATDGSNVLHIACLSGRYELMKHIVSEFPDLKNNVNVYKGTALHYCSCGGSVDIFKFLVYQGLDVFSVNTYEMNVLHVACVNGRYELVKHIVLEFPGLKNKVSVKKWTALHYCAQGGSVDVFKLLVSQGFDVTSVSTTGRNVLHIACLSGRYELVKHIVSEFPSLKNNVDVNKWSALHYCAECGSVNIFKYLVSQGIDVTSVNTDEVTVLHLACMSGRYELVRHIVSEFPGLKNKVNVEKWTVLHTCAQGGSVNIFKFLVSQGLDVTSVTPGGRNVLHISCGNGRYELVKYIVSEFPDLKHKVDVNKWTSLHHCSKGGSVDIFKFLVSQGLDVFSANTGGESVLHIACGKGRYELVSYLVNTHPGMLTATTATGQTPMDLAIINNHRQTISFLHKHQQKTKTLDPMTPAEKRGSTTTASIQRASDVASHGSKPPQVFPLSSDVDRLQSGTASTNVSSHDDQKIKAFSLNPLSDNERSANINNPILVSSDEVPSLNPLSDDDRSANINNPILVSSDEVPDHTRLSASFLQSLAEDHIEGATAMEEQASSMEDQSIRILEPDHCQACVKKDTDKLNKASWYCKNCENHLCDECKSYHGVFPPLKHHMIISIQSKCEVCDKGSPANWFCDNCRQYMCADCRTFHSRMAGTKQHRVVSSRNYHSTHQSRESKACILM